MVWKILADTVMGLHLLLMGFLAVSIVLLAPGFFTGHRNWQFFYCGVIALAIGLAVASWAGLLKSCSLTDLEYTLRRLYDPSESWMRTRSLLGTIIFIIGLGIRNSSDDRLSHFSEVLSEAGSGAQPVKDKPRFAACSAWGVLACITSN